MDFSKITDQCGSRNIKALSIKENSAVYTVKNPDGGLFVLRIYDRPMPGYQVLAEHPAFLSGHDPDGNSNHAQLRMSYMEYTIYFNPADDAARNEIVFHVTKS
ncbi:MAG: hypothetical protein MRZ97_07645 [Firmicutes bacterium]|nr:hypothetical protein [Bacillota bacterium]